MCYTKTGLPCGLLELAVRCSHGAVGRVLKLTEKLLFQSEDGDYIIHSAILDMAKYLELVT